jgi:hypothetical protein
MTCTVYTIDSYTIAHLAAWVDSAVWEDEAEDFTRWALEQIEDDPTLADYGWPSLYRAYQAR